MHKMQKYKSRPADQNTTKTALQVLEQFDIGIECHSENILLYDSKQVLEEYSISTQKNLV